MKHRDAGYRPVLNSFTSITFLPAGNQSHQGFIHIPVFLNWSVKFKKRWPMTKGLKPILQL